MHLCFQNNKCKLNHDSNDTESKNKLQILHTVGPVPCWTNGSFPYFFMRSEIVLICATSQSSVSFVKTIITSPNQSQTTETHCAVKHFMLVDVMIWSRKSFSSSMTVLTATCHRQCLANNNYIH